MGQTGKEQYRYKSSYRRLVMLGIWTCQRSMEYMTMQFSGDLDAFYLIRRKHSTVFVFWFFFSLPKSCLFILLHSVTQCRCEDGLLPLGGGNCHEVLQFCDWHT